MFSEYKNMMRWIIKLWLCVYVYVLILEGEAFAQLHPDVYLSLEQRIQRHGYPLEIHKVITEDGYILSAYRIPHGIQNSKVESKNKSAVLLAHGMGGSPHSWLLLGSKDSLPYYLADRGFDVWIGCVRGDASSFKKLHIKYDWNEDPEYWDYSLHEMGKYDLAANIDYITSHTKQAKVFFIGHSAGTPQFFILTSEKPEYNEKIKIGVQYASVPVLKRIEYMPAMLVSSFVKVWKGIIKYLGVAEFFPQFQIFYPAITAACQDPSLVKICVHVAGIIGSHNSVLMEDNIIALGSSTFPRVSTKLLLHFMDNVNDRDFRNYNYGPKKNMRIYGQQDPPRYNLSNCTAAVAFFYGPKDSFCVKEDVHETINKLPNVVLDYEVPYSKFTHIDFIVARNATNLAYEATYKLFKNYDEGKIPAKIGKRSIPDE